MYLSKDLVPLFNETLRFLASKNLPYRLLPDNELQKVSGSTHHEGVCIIAAPISTSEDRLPSYLERASGCVLFLDDVQNPHNFGAIVRTAAHLGAGAVLVTDAGFSPLSGAAYRVAEGGAEEIPVFQVSDAKKTLELLKQRKFTLVATVVEKGTSLFEAKLPERLVFLLGAEDRGLRNDLRRMADLHVTIPHLGEVESLNVATATGILLAEYQRQRSSSSGRGRRE